MKKLLVIAIALLAMGSAYAQTVFNPLQEVGTTVGTKIITPLTITVHQDAPRDFGTLIQGQQRTFANPTPIALFTINRELDQKVFFTVYEPTPATGETGVTLNTKVLRYTGDWNGGSGPVFEFAPNTSLQWESGGNEGGTQCHAAIVVTTASATATAFIGAHTFNVHIQAQYAAF